MKTLLVARSFDLVSVAKPDLLQDDPTWTLMRQVFGAIARYEKAMIVMKPPFINYAEGQGAPSTEFDTDWGVQVAVAPYTLPGQSTS